MFGHFADTTRARLIKYYWKGGEYSIAVMQAGTAEITHKLKNARIQQAKKVEFFFLRWKSHGAGCIKSRVNGAFSSGK